MAVQSISISKTLVENLRASGTPEAIALAEKFETHQISEKDFIAAAGRLGRVTSSDTAGALGRSAARLAMGKGVFLSESDHKKIFDPNSDRGPKVTYVQSLIESGRLNPTEVLNA